MLFSMWVRHRQGVPGGVGVGGGTWVGGDTRTVEETGAGARVVLKRRGVRLPVGMVAWFLPGLKSLRATCAGFLLCVIILSQEQSRIHRAVLMTKSVDIAWHVVSAISVSYYHCCCDLRGQGTRWVLRLELIQFKA